MHGICYQDETEKTKCFNQINKNQIILYCFDPWSFEE